MSLETEEVQLIINESAVEIVAANIQRLKEYIEKLVVIPRSGRKVYKAGYGRLADSSETVDK